MAGGRGPERGRRGAEAGARQRRRRARCPSTWGTPCRQATTRNACMCMPAGFRVSTLMLDALDSSRRALMNRWDALARAHAAGHRPEHDAPAQQYQLRPLRSWATTAATLACARTLAAAAAQRPCAAVDQASRGGLGRRPGQFALLADLQLRRLLHHPRPSPSARRGVRHGRASSTASSWLAGSRGAVEHRMSAPRVVLFGPMGIGKTTAIRTLCGDPARSTATSSTSTPPATTRRAAWSAPASASCTWTARCCVYGGRSRTTGFLCRQWLLNYAVGAMALLIDPHAPDALADTRARCVKCAGRHPGMCSPASCWWR